MTEKIISTYLGFDSKLGIDRMAHITVELETKAISVRCYVGADLLSSVSDENWTLDNAQAYAEDFCNEELSV